MRGLFLPSGIFSGLVSSVTCCLVSGLLFLSEAFVSFPLARRSSFIQPGSVEQCGLGGDRTVSPYLMTDPAGADGLPFGYERMNSLGCPGWLPTRSL